MTKGNITSADRADAFSDVASYDTDKFRVDAFDSDDDPRCSSTQEDTTPPDTPSVDDDFVVNSSYESLAEIPEVYIDVYLAYTMMIRGLLNKQFLYSDYLAALDDYHLVKETEDKECIGLLPFPKCPGVQLSPTPATGSKDSLSVDNPDFDIGKLPSLQRKNALYRK